MVVSVLQNTFATEYCWVKMKKIKNLNIFCSRLALFSWRPHTLSHFFERLATSSHRHCHSARSARLLFFVIGSLFLLASRSRELLPDWTIGDATPGSTCMFPGTLPRRLDSQLVSPHPLYNRLIRDTSPGAARSPDFARTFHQLYNPRKAGSIIIPHRRRHRRIS